MPASPPVRVVPPAARDAILAWYDEHGRTLAFRRTTDPYAVLVSEAMAQQTQAARAAGYWERWMVRFPTVADLAAASLADVLREWQGLGYDRRGLALWRAARIIVDTLGGRVPDTVEGLQALPGVGPYTARAVAAIAFGRPVGAVDVNVRRVLSRLAAGDADDLEPTELQALADRSVPIDRSGDWTHALMDLGATLCRPRTPRCDACPVLSWCRYAAVSDVGDTTTRAPETATHAARPRPVATPFASTNRWLRGRILDRLRAAPDGEWVELEAPIGGHDRDRIVTAARAMARDGVLELGPAERGAISARLPVA